MTRYQVPVSILVQYNTSVVTGRTGTSFIARNILQLERKQDELLSCGSSHLFAFF